MTTHLPIGLVARDGHETVCHVCLEDLVIFAEPGGPLLIFEFAEDSPGRDAGLFSGWDRDGRPDGWMALRPHVCATKGGSI